MLKNSSGAAVVLLCIDLKIVSILLLKQNPPSIISFHLGFCCCFVKVGWSSCGLISIRLLVKFLICLLASTLPTKTRNFGSTLLPDRYCMYIAWQNIQYVLGNNVGPKLVQKYLSAIMLLQIQSSIAIIIRGNLNPARLEGSNIGKDYCKEIATNSKLLCDFSAPP